MDSEICNFNRCDNQYRHRSKTFQPPSRALGPNNTRDQWGPMVDKSIMLRKYFQTTLSAHAEQAKYANLRQDSPYYNSHHLSPQHMQHPSGVVPHPQFVHNRSQSHSHSHHYHTMSGVVFPYYCNLQPVQPVMEAQRSPPRMHDPAPLVSPPLHARSKMDPMQVMQVQLEIDELPFDLCPTIPKSRDYTVATLPDGNTYRIKFPQKRRITSEFHDPSINLTVPKDSGVTVLGPSQSDRSKFTVIWKCCSQSPIVQFDIQHQLTKM